jgi:L-ascorbate metabolism protein UlaG (beta-lactamase superfamily)
MEITWLGDTCIRMRGREGVVAADAFRSVAGPTGRGLTADICTYSHADPSDPPRPGTKAAQRAGPAKGGLGIVRPSSLESAFVIDAPGEYEVHDILITGVRTFRDEAQGAVRGFNTTFVFELDGIHVAHLGDTGHPLNDEMRAEIGSVQVACVPIGSALTVAHAAEMVGALDANLVVPMPTGDDPELAQRALERFLKEMSVTDPQPVQRLSVSISTVPQEATVVVLEARGKS